MSASERFRRLSWEGFWVVLGQLAAVSGSLIGVRLLTELLDPATYGELTLCMTMATLVNQTVLGPLGNGIARFYAPAQEQGDIGSYLRASSRLVLIASLVIGIAMVVTIAGLKIASLAGWIAVTCAALVFAVLSGWSSVVSSIQGAARQRSVVALHQGLESWLRFLLAAALLMWWGPRSAIALTGYVLALLIVLASQYFFLGKLAIAGESVPESAQRWQTRIWSFSWPISIFGIFTWMQLASDRWALVLFSTTQEVGLYAVLFQLGYYPISLVSGMVVSFLAPIFYQRSGDASDAGRNAYVNRMSWKIAWWSLAFTLGAFLAAFFFHALLFQLFVAAEYRVVSGLFPWVILAGGVFAASQSLSLGLMSQMKTRNMMSAKIVTAIVGVLLNLAGAHWFGIAGIVYAGVVFSILFFSWILLVFRSEALSS